MFSHLLEEVRSRRAEVFALAFPSQRAFRRLRELTLHGANYGVRGGEGVEVLSRMAAVFTVNRLLIDPSTPPRQTRYIFGRTL